MFKLLIKMKHDGGSFDDAATRFGVCAPALLMEGQLASTFALQGQKRPVFPALLQIQKRSGAWFYKGRDQQLLPSPLPLSTPPHPRSSDPGGHVGSRPTPAKPGGSFFLQTVIYTSRLVTSAFTAAGDMLSPQSRSRSRRRRRSAQMDGNRQRGQQLTAVMRLSRRQQLW